MYRHIKTYELKYTDVDVYDNLKLSSLLAFLEESACLSADELGFGYKAVSAKKMGFIIANWYIKLDRAIKLGDKVTLHTWPLAPKHLIFLRDFEIYSNGQKVGVATARWCMIDTENYNILPAKKFFAEGAFDNYNTQRSIEFNEWKIQRIDCGEEIYSKLVTYSDCDHYFHANNTKYADFLLDVFSIEELKDKTLESVGISYIKQCKQGEIIKFSKQLSDGYYLIEGSVDGELRVQMRIRFNG